jgi:hypothetical protein
MQMFRLLLELSRLQTIDRTTANYRPVPLQ